MTLYIERLNIIIYIYKNLVVHSYMDFYGVFYLCDDNVTTICYNLFNATDGDDTYACAEFEIPGNHTKESHNNETTKWIFSAQRYTVNSKQT